MKKEKNGVKVAVLSLFMAGVLMLPMMLGAQKSDAFFKSYNNDDIYNDRDGEGFLLGGITNNENPTEEAPLGSGLFVLMAAGAGYIMARRKRALRKGATMLLSIGLILGMTQCKKNMVAPMADEGVYITLQANYGGAKTTFDPSTGQFAWSTEATEYINVYGSTSGYLGQLDNSEALGTGTFAGTLNKTPKSGEALYFFYLGNGSHAGATNVDFSNQSSGNVTDCHVAIGSQTYSGQTSFNASLNLAMAIARIDLSEFGTEDVFIHGDNLYSSLSISYITGSLSYVSGVQGYMRIKNNGEDTYIALLPTKTESEITLKLESNKKTGSEITFLRGIKPGYYYSNNGEALSVSTPTAITDDVVPGLFSVSDTKMVRFSKGNLRYYCSTSSPQWSFADNQYDVVEYDAIAYGENTNKWIDLFGWGTSGWDNGNKCYVPYSTSNSTSGDYSSSKGYGYGPQKDGSYNNSLEGEFDKSDWGVLNSTTIANGGGYSNWRTLSSSEYKHLLETRSASNVNNIPNARYAKAIITTTNGSVRGLLVFPDDYKYPLNSYPTNFTVNSTGKRWATYTVSELSTLQNDGAVFLPAAGYRDGSTLNNNSSCYYHTTTHDGTSKNKCFNVQDYQVKYDFSQVRYCGCSVRLVRE